jgi:UrcA family protein
MSRLTKYAAACCILFTCIPAALASDRFTGGVTTAIAVAYGDLDLTGPAGVNTLLKRVKAASETVCGPSAPTLKRELARINAHCRYTAASDGLRQLHNPDVMTAFEQYAGRTKIYASR